MNSVPEPGPKRVKHGSRRTVVKLTLAYLSPVVDEMAALINKVNNATG